jgi:predicted HTH transcriptional regulator
MPIDLKNFVFHRAVVVHQVLDQQDFEAARKYVDALGSRVTNDLPHDPDAQAGVAELRGYLLALEAVAGLAKAQRQQIEEYLRDLCDER